MHYLYIIIQHALYYYMHLNKEVNPGNQWAPNKYGRKPGRKCALNRGYALIKQMRLTTSRYGITTQTTLTKNKCDAHYTHVDSHSTFL